MIEHLTKESFKEKVRGFNENSEWKNESEKPFIIDFYAPWCGPCKALSPILEDVKKEYGEDVEIYKVNTDEEPELALQFKIRGVPTIAFIPVGEQPFTKVGAMPIPMFKKVISESFHIEK
jgi:thioredoxin